MKQLTAPPVSIGQQIQITITSLGQKGDGVGRYRDFVIVVPHSILHKKYVVEISNVHASYAFAFIKEELA